MSGASSDNDIELSPINSQVHLDDASAETFQGTTGITSIFTMLDDNEEPSSQSNMDVSNALSKPSSSSSHLRNQQSSTNLETGTLVSSISLEQSQKLRMILIDSIISDGSNKAVGGINGDELNNPNGMSDLTGKFLR